MTAAEATVPAADSPKITPLEAEARALGEAHRPVRRAELAASQPFEHWPSRLAGALERAQRHLAASHFQDAELQKAAEWFLAAPISWHGSLRGNFYLTDKLGADRLDEDDEEMVVTLAAHEAVAIGETAPVTAELAADWRLRCPSAVPLAPVGPWIEHAYRRQARPNLPPTVGRAPAGAPPRSQAS